ncbi:MAG: VanZ family protein [Eubacterium sp.]|nr:VanZ family protein [Eubacterium sp.]
MNNNALKKSIFVLAFFFSMFNMHSDMLGSYWGLNGTPFMFFRFAIIIVLMAVVTLINKDNLDFIANLVPKSALIFTALVIFDYFITHISGSHFLYRVWWISYIIITLMTVFIVVTLMKYDRYPEFYKRFWLSFTPIYAFVLYICFMRLPSNIDAINMKLGDGTFLMLKALINDFNVGFEAPLMFFGNIIIFVPLPFVLSAISDKFKPPIIMLIGFVVPFIVESYQYIFKCGQVDIDDIVLNFGGFLMAFIVYMLIKKYKLNATEKPDS